MPAHPYKFVFFFLACLPYDQALGQEAEVQDNCAKYSAETFPLRKIRMASHNYRASTRVLVREETKCDSNVLSLLAECPKLKDARQNQELNGRIADFLKGAAESCKSAEEAKGRFDKRHIAFRQFLVDLEGESDCIRTLDFSKFVLDNKAKNMRENHDRALRKCEQL